MRLAQSHSSQLTKSASLFAFLAMGLSFGVMTKRAEAGVSVTPLAVHIDMDKIKKQEDFEVRVTGLSEKSHIEVDLYKGVQLPSGKVDYQKLDPASKEAKYIKLLDGPKAMELNKGDRYVIKGVFIRPANLKDLNFDYVVMVTDKQERRRAGQKLKMDYRFAAQVRVEGAAKRSALGKIELVGVKREGASILLAASLKNMTPYMAKVAVTATIRDMKTNKLIEKLPMTYRHNLEPQADKKRVPTLKVYTHNTVELLTKLEKATLPKEYKVSFSAASANDDRQRTSSNNKFTIKPELLSNLPIVYDSELKFGVRLFGQAAESMLTVTNPNFGAAKVTLTANKEFPAYSKVTFSESNFSLAPGESKRIKVSLGELPKGVDRAKDFFKSRFYIAASTAGGKSLGGGEIFPLVASDATPEQIKALLDKNTEKAKKEGTYGKSDEAKPSPDEKGKPAAGNSEEKDAGKAANEEDRSDKSEVMQEGE